MFFVPLLLTFLTGGRLRTRMDRVLIGAIIFEIAVLAPLYLTVTDLPGNLLLISSDAAAVHRDRPSRSEPGSWSSPLPRPW